MELNDDGGCYVEMVMVEGDDGDGYQVVLVVDL